MTPYERVRIQATLLAVTGLASAAGLSAHIVRGLDSPTAATAFVSSPSATADAPIRVSWGAIDTGLRIVCFNVANTSPVGVDDPGSPRITGAGFELPGAPRGFTLLTPIDGWTLVEGTQVTTPGVQAVTLDFALQTHSNQGDWEYKSPMPHVGIAPGQPAVRGSGVRFCISGPFPDTLPNPAIPGATVATTVELLINGVVVRFARVNPQGQSPDLGLWDNPLRAVPLYLE